MFQLILGRRASRSAHRIGFTSNIHPDSPDLITYSGDGHIITFAPTGTGKTSGPVIVNALRHGGQLIVLDMKGEVYTKTADARRAMGQEVHVLDLRDGGLPGSLNPLDLALRCGTETAAIARSLAGEIVEREEQERDRFWGDWSETMVTGGITWLLAHKPPEERCISTFFDLLTGEDPTYNIASILDGTDVNRSVYAAFRPYLDLPDRETRPCVLGSTIAHLRLFDTDLTRRLTDTTSFDIDAFIEGQPMSLYIIIPPFRLTAYRPLLRLWLSGLILTMTQRQPHPDKRTLILCDEIGNLGKIDALITAATLLRSWGITLWTFWQNPAQINIYGTQAHTLIDNAGVIQTFGARNRRMAAELAALIGTVDADTILNMKPDEQLLLIEGKPVRCKQTRYYDDEAFLGHTKS